MSKAISALLSLATAQIGYHEKASNSDLDSFTGNAGTRNFTKFARDLDAIGTVYNGRKNGYDWCDVFVDWCFITLFGLALGMKLLCQAYKGCGAGCNWSAGYYKAKGQFYKTGPQVGDQIFYDWDLDGEADHTGIVTAVTNGYVYTIEGNTSDQENPGDVVVAEKCRPLNYKFIFGYGRPDWSLTDGWSPAPETTDGTATDYTAVVMSLDGLNLRTGPSTSNAIIKALPYGSTVHVTRESNGWGYTGEGWICLLYIGEKIPAENPEQNGGNEMSDYNEFKNFMAQYIAEQESLKGSDWAENDGTHRWATDNGVVKGDGSKLGWQSFITKEQAAAMIKRAAEVA